MAFNKPRTRKGQSPTILPKPEPREIVWPESQARTLKALNDTLGCVTTEHGRRFLVALGCEHWAPNGVCRFKALEEEPVA